MRGSTTLTRAMIKNILDFILTQLISSRTERWHISSVGLRAIIADSGLELWCVENIVNTPLTRQLKMEWHGADSISDPKRPNKLSSELSWQTRYQFRCSVDNHAYPLTSTSAGRRRRLACFAMVSAAHEMAPQTNYTINYIAATHLAIDYTGQSVTLRTTCSNGNTGSWPNNTYAGLWPVEALLVELSANSHISNNTSQFVWWAVTKHWRIYSTEWCTRLLWPSVYGW